MKEVFLMKDNSSNTLFHLAAKENRWDIMKLLLDFGKASLGFQQLSSLLLVKNNKEVTVFYTLVLQGRFEMVKLMFEEDILSIEERRMLITATDKFNRTALHISAARNHQKLLKYLLNESRILMPAEDCNRILMSRDSSGFKVLDIAEKSGHLDVVKIVSYKLSEIQAIICMLKDLHKSQCYAVQDLFQNEIMDFEYVETLCHYFKEEALSAEQRRKALRATDSRQRSVFHLSAYYYHENSLAYLLNDKTLSAKELKEVLMLQDDEKRTALHVAVGGFLGLRVTKLLLNKIRKLLSFAEFKTFFLLTNVLGETVLHTALKKQYDDDSLVNYLLYELRGSYRHLSAIPEVFLMKDNFSNTVFHLASEKIFFTGRHYYVIEELLAFGKESLPSEQFSSLLMEKNKSGVTAFYLAVTQRNYQIVKWLLRKDILSVEERRMLITATDNFKVDESRVNAFYFAVAQGNCEMVQLFLSKDILPVEEQRMLITATDSLKVDKRGVTAFYFAVIQMNYEMVKLLFSEDILMVEERRMLITATDNFNRTVFHILAAVKYDHRILDLLLDRNLLSKFEWLRVLKSRDSSGCTVFEIAKKSDNSLYFDLYFLKESRSEKLVNRIVAKFPKKKCF